MEVCKTCGIVAGTHACNPLDINMKNMRLAIQNQQSKINILTAKNAKLCEAFRNIKKPMLMTSDMGIECLVYEFLDNPYSLAQEALSEGK